MKDNSAAVHAQVPVEVASFLLNEKRSEIAKIELQQRINVLLVPNKSLETPHYKLERLKHDDPRLDRIEASYKMAEEIEDATTVTRRSQEPTNKQTPVIKGVLPDAPAPAAAPKPQSPTTKAAARNTAPAATAPMPPAAQLTPAAVASGGFFGWLKNLVMGAVAEPVTPPAAKTDEKMREVRRDGERRDGGRENGREAGSRDGSRGEGRRGRDGRRGERTESAAGEVRAGREGGRRSDARQEGRSEGRMESPDADARPARGERTERADRALTDRPARDGRREGRDAREGRSELRQDDKNDTRADAQSELKTEGSDARQDRAPREERSNEGRRERAPQARRERGERNDRNDGAKRDAEPRASDPLATNPAGQDLVTNDDPSTHSAQDGDSAKEQNGERRERRSRDRYGRERRERSGESPRQDLFDEDKPSASAASPEGMPSVASDMPSSARQEPNADERPAPRSYFERAQQAAAGAAPSTDATDATDAGAASDQAAQPAATGLTAAASTESPSTPAAPAHTALPTAATVPASVVERVALPDTDTALRPEPVVSTADADAAPPATPTASRTTPASQLPEVSRYQLPIDSLQQVAATSGLVWVNSDADKVATVQAAIAAEPQPVRVPRERAPLAVISEGPLVLVETRKDLSTLKVPF
jgi:ribonuclease E